MPTATYRPLANITLGSTTSSVSFSAIPASYRDLIVIIQAGAAVGSPNFQLSLNGDTTNANYSAVQISGSGSVVDGSAFISGQQRFINFYGYLETDLHGSYVVNIMDYSATDKHKTYLSRASHADNGVAAVATRWANTAAVTSILLNPEGQSFRTGSTFALYGVIA
jgi:hypothetical protein